MFAGNPTAASSKHTLSRFQTGVTNVELLPGTNESSVTGAEKGSKKAAKP